MKKPLFLKLDEVVRIHRDQLERYGGHSGIRDVELLQSALAMPSAGFAKDYLHADIYEMAAAYLFHIIKNHPFVDGNKRTGGAAAALVFLIMNGAELNADEESFEKMVRSVAEREMDKAAVAEFFKKHDQV